jgi:hypothetical protein
MNGNLRMLIKNTYFMRIINKNKNSEGNEEEKSFL